RDSRAAILIVGGVCAAVTEFIDQCTTGASGTLLRPIVVSRGAHAGRRRPVLACRATRATRRALPHGARRETDTIRTHFFSASSESAGLASSARPIEARLGDNCCASGLFRGARTTMTLARRYQMRAHRIVVELVAIGLLAVTSAFAQTSSRTPWGDPDLQG